ncbi:type II toxin-antitoxin system HicB family antitoxin [Xanthobacter agilis]|uniref:type II toxin-antitoxin system HicB family antitoxin n=1 Tax=Xanthobacter agilis TaxID=47492 RepID=UPI003727903C
MAYVVGIIHEEGGVFGISFPDFPGAVSTGDGFEDAIAKGAQVLAFHVAGMIEDKDSIPEPRPLRAILAAAPEWLEGGVAVLIPVDLPGKSVRINISVDENALNRIDRAAKAAGQTRSAFLVKAALERARSHLEAA